MCSEDQHRFSVFMAVAIFGEVRAPVARRDVNDVPCDATIKHECRSSMAFCIP